jgi:glycosyltransferase involved in cell wall biosynthesis
MPSIAACLNVYQDAAALRGALECAAPYFDNIYVVHSGPGGAHSTDGTIELCEQFGATIVFDDINKGFGVIRSRLIHDCGCEWAFLMDADERFHPQLPVMYCTGDQMWDANRVGTTNRSVKTNDVINQGKKLRELCARKDIDAVRSSRRHWYDFGMNQPSQNWFHVKDHQLRIVRNIPEIQYRGDVKMHERLLDTRTGADPRFAEQCDIGGIFHDHYHLFYRRTQPGHKEWNEQQYAKLQAGGAMEVKQP